MSTYAPKLHIVLVHPEIPQNTGNIGRTCVAVGAKLWLVRPCGFQLDDHHLRRAGLDYWQHLAWEAVENWSVLQSRLASHRFWYYTRHAIVDHWTIDFAESDVLVFGSETQGLSRDIITAAPPGTAIRIPMADEARSLNLSNAVAIAAYEALRPAR